MKIRCAWEHNGEDTLLYAIDYIGAFARGADRESAMKKMPQEIAAYLAWINEPVPDGFTVEIAEEKSSDLQIADADSDMIFGEEKASLTWEEYTQLKELALKSAEDFLVLYESVPDKNASCLPVRATFYGEIPRTAQEMYEHTKNVNSYYFQEIGVAADNEGSIYECRRRGFELLEQTKDFLNNPVVLGSYDEMWSLRKVLRRFVWHDRIHAKAMYRMAVKTFGTAMQNDPFYFEKVYRKM